MTSHLKEERHKLILKAVQNDDHVAVDTSNSSFVQCITTIVTDSETDRASMARFEDLGIQVRVADASR